MTTNNEEVHLVRYRGGETHQRGATIGIYTLHSTDELYMTGYVEIRNSLGQVFPVLASLLEDA